MIKVSGDFMYLRVLQNLVIWSISKDSVFTKFANKIIDCSKQLPFSSKIIDEEENLLSFVNYSPMTKLLGMKRSHLAFNEQEIKSKTDQTAIDWISEAGIAIISSKNETIISDIQGNK
jgi:hypothetical protein